MVPNVIWNMRYLRHLYMCGHKTLACLQFDTLEHLQTLSEVHVNSWKQNNSTKLVSLRKLGIRGNLSSDTRAFFKSLAALPQLQSLNLHAEDAEFPSLAQLASLHSLVKLHLSGRIPLFPMPEEFPPTLSQLTLEFSRLEQKSIDILAKLPRLETLRLKAQSYREADLTISVNGFAQLEFLEFNSLDSLQNFNVEGDAIPRLRNFRIANCKGLIMLPAGMKNVTSLHELEVEEMPKVFVDRLRGDDFHKVQHISSLTFI
uniref:Disease resistance R13L4/SHOC-2-like LRR domain-containing protein n=1 Tax=Rhizophora mucronata TaxID=61149 RepID=A0A2P2P206_RHIMU